jgi:hypothetical protein
MKVKKIIFIAFLLTTESLRLVFSFKQSVLDFDPGEILGPITPQCQSTLFEIMSGSEFFKCIPITAFPHIIPIIANSKIIQELLSDPTHNYKEIREPLIKFSKKICAAPKCKDKSVEDAIKLFKNGCKDDIVNNKFIKTLLDVAVFYSPIRDITCFKDKIGDFCWDRTLKTIFNLPSSPIIIVDTPIIDSVALAEHETVCTACNKAIFITIFNFLTESDNAKEILKLYGIGDKEISIIKFFVAFKCGFEFEGGEIDPGS